MKINIASFGGRTHMLDTARELEKFGHEIRFYSFVPDRRAVKFGLKKECNRSYFILAIPFLVLRKITSNSFWSLYLFHRFFDIYVGLIMPKCDIFIGQSPMHVFALKRAKRKYNAKIILERGTSHVLEQIKALKENPIFKSKNPMPNIFLRRDLEGYEIADYISVASNHVYLSFIKNNISPKKMLVNPYGVNLSEFNATKLEENDFYDFIMVGQWCHRKGCDLITQAFSKMPEMNFLHVGSIIDMDFPTNINMKHIDSVDQKELINYYKKARVFILPSREEGLALVQLQAVATGLPLVCSKYTGGRDLKDFIDDPKWIVEMSDMTVDSLIYSAKKALELSKTQNGLRSYCNDGLKKFSWEAYGERYNNFLIKLT